MNSDSAVKLALLVVASDRRVYLESLAISLKVKRLREIDHVLLVDTATFPVARSAARLQRLYDGCEIMELPGVSFHRVLRIAWKYLKDEVGATHVLMFEEDFILLRQIPVQRLVALANLDNILQVVMPRQRWFEAEFRHRDRRGYLRANRPFRETSHGDELEGYFTSNPHCMRLDRIVPLLAEVEPSDDYTWEWEYGEASASHALASLQVASVWPWVWHIGAATSLGIRTTIEQGRSTLIAYLRAHLKRAFIGAFRRLPISRQGHTR
ncbi:MAG: hypothetical protein ACOX61_04165 [Brooklawnia sp.]